MIASLMSGALSIYLAIYSPTADNRDSFVRVASILLAISVIGLIIHTVIAYKDQQTEKKERERNQRMIAEIWAKEMAVAGIMAGVQAPQTGKVEVACKSPLKLRESALMLAKKYRDFAHDAESKEPSQDIMPQFWDKYPFKELDNIKERIKIPLGQWNVTSAADYLPNTPENIRKIADALEKEALQVPPDVLL